MEAGRWKAYYRPFLGSIIHYIVKDHAPIEDWTSSIGEIRDISIKHNRLSFSVDIDDIDFKKYKKRTPQGIIVEILDGKKRPVFEVVVEKPGRNVTFGWEYV